MNIRRNQIVQVALSTLAASGLLMLIQHFQGYISQPPIQRAEGELRSEMGQSGDRQLSELPHAAVARPLPVQPSDALGWRKDSNMIRRVGHGEVTGGDVGTGGGGTVRIASLLPVAEDTTADAVGAVDSDSTELLRAAAETFLKAATMKRVDAAGSEDSTPALVSGVTFNREAIDQSIIVTFTPNWNGLSFENATIGVRTANGVKLGQQINLDSTSNAETSVKLDLSTVANQGPVECVLVARIETKNERDHLKIIEAKGTPFTIAVDSIGPRIIRVDFDTSEKPSYFRVYFAESDFAKYDQSDIKSFFQVQQILGEGSYANKAIKGASLVKEMSGRDPRAYVQLSFDSLDSGTYRVLLPYLEDATDVSNGLLDVASNPAGADGKFGRSQSLVVDVYAKPPQGNRIEFPEFAATLPQPRKERRINAGDKVETAVVRLYYFRDAHRVAQLVNRTVEPLNRAAVERAEIAAAKAREAADDLTLDRRSKEREAVRDAQTLRRAESEIADGRRKLAEIQNEKQQIRRAIQINNHRIDKLSEQMNAPSSGDSNDGLLESDSEPDGEVVRALSHRDPRFQTVSAVLQDETTTALPVDSATIVDAAVPGSLQAQINDLVRSNTRYRDRWNILDAEEDRLGDLERSLTSLRDDAFTSNEAAIELNEKEELARANQFRLEVAAAQADPDTYGPAKLDSVDPVAQVSISVIGEGLIQLRGPRKGINTIRTMIHQIDAPVGQVKVDVITVQVNGENAERMEAPVGKIDAHLKISRGLTSQCLMMLRQSIQQEATQIATMYSAGHYQIDRDRRYLYAFFGRDFIDELYEMDSEFLRSENKILGLHSMDTISLHQALFVLALAKNDVRQRILANFMDRVRTELVDAEFNMRRSAEVFPHKTRYWLPHHDRAKLEACSYEGVCLNNHQRYHFTHLMNFFGAIQGICGVASGVEGDSDTLNPVQREFLRLAQIFKSRLVTELELKQRLIERTMIEDNVLNEIQEEEIARNSLRPKVLQLSRVIQDRRLEASQNLATAQVDAQYWQDRVPQELAKGIQQASLAIAMLEQLDTTQFDTLPPGAPKAVSRAKEARELLAQLNILASHGSPRTKTLATLKANIREVDSVFSMLESGNEQALGKLLELESQSWVRTKLKNLISVVSEETDQHWKEYHRIYGEFVEAIDPLDFNYKRVVAAYQELKRLERALENREHHLELFQTVEEMYETARGLARVELEYANAKEFLRKTRSRLEQRKLLDFLIQEQEEKLIDLLEGTRARIAAIDGYLKRLSVALEDDFQVQFYDPAFVRVRQASRNWDVTFGQVERTSVLTNNRAFAKVSPQATMEFDLPKRKIAIVEALDGAKALAEDYGALMQDPTFLAAFQMMGGAPSNGMVQNVYPSLPTSGEQQQMGFAPLPDQQSGAALQALVPDPSIYKIETGTGYEIRPVIQPDGISVVYDFNYMYTTNVREPVQADEKHLGRVKRHFINTQVQTTSFELRRVSRYQVALKVARTSQGVPLLQDIPGVGALFRPAASDEASIQENIILSQSVVYPTVFDVMGLRWAPSVVDLNHLSVRDREHVVRGRGQVITNSVFDETTRTVDEVLGLKRRGAEFDRKDLYHLQRQPSPYHPGGYVNPEVKPESDPQGRGYIRPEQRPTEFRDPPYDDRRRVPVTMEPSTVIPYEAPMTTSPQSTPVESIPFEHVDLGQMEELLIE